MQLRFVSAFGGSAFMHELLRVVAHEVSALGVATTLSEGAYPSLEPGDTYVVVPHEYFVVTPRSQYPSAQQLGRTIAFCVEHPGTDTFETTAQWAAVVGRVLDINEDSTLALRSRGIPAERFTLGYSSLWDVWHGDESRERHLDVTHLGTTEPRRSRALASYSELLAPRLVHLLIPPHEPMTAPRPDFFITPTKLEFLRGSKVLLNLHRAQSTSLEWVRVLEALCNGCVVVSEQSADYEPLVPGRHIVFGHWRSLGQLTDLLLDDPERLRQLRQGAYGFLTSELTMRPAAARLVELASDLEISRSPHRHARSTGPTEEPAVRFALRASDGTGAVYAPAQLPQIAAAARPALAHLLERTELSAAEQPQLRNGPDRAPGSIDAIVAQPRGDPSPDRTVASMLLQQAGLDLRVLVSPDGRATLASADGPLADPRVVLHVSDAPAVTGAERNRLLAVANAEYVLVLEPTDTLLPGALLRLVELLHGSASSAACYPLTAEENGEIGNALPFEPRRLATRDYLGAPALWRRSALVALGGWCQEPELESLENYDLWLRLAAAKGQAQLLPQVLVRRRFRPVTPLRLAHVDPERAQRMLRARSRGLNPKMDAVVGVGEHLESADSDPPWG